MKTERLLGIVVYLLRHDNATARELSGRFEVAPRTIQRDIASLCEAGIPVASEAGRDGGYHIMESFRMDHIASELDRGKLVTAMRGLLSAWPDEKTERTLDKLLPGNTLPGQRMVLDFSVASEREDVNVHLRELDAAIGARERVAITYSSADGAQTMRVIEPLELRYQWHGWYVAAWCALRQDYRTFKVVRIRSLQKTNLPFQREHPPSGELFREEFSRGMESYPVLLHCREQVRAQVEEYLGDCIVDEDEDGFYLEMDATSGERMWFGLLLSFGDAVEVIEPDFLRARIRGYAREWMRMYNDEEE